jgi:Tfp pilus assembly protein FimT
MKPASSPIFTAAIFAALALAAFSPSALAQQTTSTTESVTQTTTTTAPKAIRSTEIDFLPASAANDLDVQMMRDFGNVKQSDPKIATDVARNPEVVANASYVTRHPALEAFLEKYPAARDQIVTNPGNFVTPVPGSKWNSHEAAGIPRD